MRKKLGIGVSAVLAFALGGLVVHAATPPPPPEVNPTTVTQSLKGNLIAKTCVGEDGQSYVTLRGNLAGVENEAATTTDYSLAGNLAVNKVKWTINTQTARGILFGSVVLTTPASATPIFKGSITMITQGEAATGATVQGRGWMTAAFPLPGDEGSTTVNDDRLFANVEWGISAGAPPAYTVTGGFGDSTLGFQDFSVLTDTQTTPSC